MSDRTGIEWTDATWNPVWGCTPVSPGCDHCYAETLVNGRLAHLHPGGFGVVRLRPEQLDKPLRWQRPRRIFVNSMSDLFHDDIPDEYIAQVFAVMALAPQHTFQVLTKRHGRMRSLLNSLSFRIRVDSMEYQMAVGLATDQSGDQLPVDQTRAHASRESRRLPDGSIPPRWPLPNVWLGVSVETQQWADIRIPALLDTPAAVRFLSCEPLLGPVELEFIHYYDAHCGGCSGILSPAHEPSCGVEPGKHWGIDWVIAGGESGRAARPMSLAWARSLRDQCKAAGVPFLFKQWGEWAPDSTYDDRGQLVEAQTDESMTRIGKKAAGRELDGRTWDEFPQAVTA
jgi:protein gp37